MAIDPSGRIVCSAAGADEEIFDAEVGAPGPADSRAHYLALMREDLYDLGMGATGLEPVTSGLSSRRSPN